MSSSFYQPFDIEPYAGDTKAGNRDSRTAFQRDRDRVIFSYAFRRLQSKTQVFQSGEYDFYRTRLTHSLEVARIARSIGEELNSRYGDIQLDGDLLEAVGLSHDLGHPPFGHIGERKLNEMMAPWGGFEGNAQTARILTKIFWARERAPQGMQPSRAFLDGVLKYKALWSEFEDAPCNHFLYDDQRELRSFIAGGQWPASVKGKPANAYKSLECQVMDWADDTAYSLHDIVDGVQAGFIHRAALEQWRDKATGETAQLAKSPALAQLLEMLNEEYLEARFARKVGEFLRAVTLEPWPDNPIAEQSARHRWKLVVPPDIKTESQLYKRIALDLVFRAPRIQQVEYKSGFLLERLFNALFDNHVASVKPHPLAGKLVLLPEPTLSWVARTPDESTRARMVCDFIAQMTDHEAIRLYRRLFDPDYGSISELI